MKLEQLKKKKIAVLGFGKEGKDTFFALRKLFPKKVIGIADKEKVEKPDKNTKIYSGKNYLKALDDYELIFKTPGIPISKIKKYKKKITSQAEILFDNFKGLIIGITGTKGKGTTATLIYQILKKAGFKVYLVGNIGKPVFQKLLKAKEDEILVYELSSHQLQTLKKSPQIAVFLNLFPDHLDYYKNFKEYQRAKENIFRYQKKEDFLIYNPELKNIVKKAKSKKIPFKKGMDVSLKGDFNQLNAEAAFLTVKLLNVPDKTIKSVLKNFKGLKHRLEYVGKLKGIHFYNDSMSTLPEVTIAALKALPKTSVLIFGGSDKGSDYRKLSELVAKKRIQVIVLGEGTGQKLKTKKTKVFSMEEAVKLCFEKAKKGEVCLLSPGSASFNLFSDYKERGDLFKKWVKYYGKKKN